ncbi:MAG TPA: dihydrofolate reductase [Candidatus Enterocloster excrementipullorum]|uniref:Dihydrofolate reductase n=1 Tax=Candidatus Enterocloster excrementipullorum TaxID=2838559 RepID=A0A9D2N1N9_9FIRM|nr:dihydrofolate reductase [Candidatus Enterocloster excrementipullorum]
MFEKLVAIEPVSLVPQAEKELLLYARQVKLYEDIPADDEEIVRRIGDADAVLVSYTSQIRRPVIERCPNIRYIGMCCSLYSEESANVDIACARERGIVVKGIRDYGDRGVVEFAVSELVRFLHGFDRPMLYEMPAEITDLPVGIVGLGTSGGMIAQAMQFMGAKVSYFSRTRKPDWEKNGFSYLPLKELLAGSQVVFTCLNKNVILLGKEEFEALGQGKILFNTSIGPSHEIDALSEWLAGEKNYFVCDTEGALGDPSGQLLAHPQVFCAGVSVGRTRQAFVLLSRKVLDNIRAYLGE